MNDGGALKSLACSSNVVFLLNLSGWKVLERILRIIILSDTSLPEFTIGNLLKSIRRNLSRQGQILLVLPTCTTPSHLNQGFVEDTN